MVGHDLKRRGNGLHNEVERLQKEKDNSDVKYKDFNSDLIVREYWKKLGQHCPHIIQRGHAREEKAKRRAAKLDQQLHQPVIHDVPQQAERQEREE